mmetsp:Transcript_7909/g.15893  ORF Transcript_7909/g.15893 Transcript_7909/m.15893 type:complete len:200 (+) Transcript_7909:480-1079(+)
MKICHRRNTITFNCCLIVCLGSLDFGIMQSQVLVLFTLSLTNTCLPASFLMPSNSFENRALYRFSFRMPSETCNNSLGCVLFQCLIQSSVPLLIVICNSLFPSIANGSNIKCQGSQMCRIISTKIELLSILPQMCLESIRPDVMSHASIPFPKLSLCIHSLPHQFTAWSKIRIIILKRGSSTTLSSRHNLSRSLVNVCF